MALNDQNDDDVTAEEGTITRQREGSFIRPLATAMPSNTLQISCASSRAHRTALHSCVTRRGSRHVDERPVRFLGQLSVESDRVGVSARSGGDAMVCVEIS